MKTKIPTKPTNYVIVTDYDSRNNYLDDQTLLGWDNDTDWFDHYTSGDDLITPTGRIKRNKWGLIFFDNIGVYVSDELTSEIKDTCDSGNKEGYNCTVCKIEKDSDGEWIVVPVTTTTTTD